MFLTPDTDSFSGLPAGSKILLAFSGGIDSSVAAKICMDAGYSVLPVYLRMNPSDPVNGPERMRLTADALGLKPLVIDCMEEFREKVMRPCWEIFESGRTPNPCVLCNPLFKFGKLQEVAQKNKCSAMATGHYARLQRKTESGQTILYRGADAAKDQSYFLYGLSQKQLAFSCFPLGNMTKAEVRQIAGSLNLPNADAPESQDVCFVPPNEQAGDFLHRYFHGASRCGCFVSTDGKFLGKHNGIHAFTPGQRKGTGVALGRPAYVRSIDYEKAEIVLTPDSEDLMSTRFSVENIFRLDVPEGTNHFHADVQVRYRGRPAPAEIVMTPDHTAEVCFDSPQRAITPGQAAVFYDGIRQIGGGVIGNVELPPIK